EAAGLEGVRLRPCWFRPTTRKHAGELCGGLQLHVTDARAFRPLYASIAVLVAARTFSGFDWRRDEYEFVSDRLAIDLLFGDDRPRLLLEKGAPAAEVMALLDEDKAAVSAQREGALHPGYA